jgi:ectoine hydroxylase-related dioxygenase (phytanoyl-CoA dioxygenase family)
MTARVETETFCFRDRDAREFLAEHGYVVVRDLLSESHRKAISEGWASIVAEGATRAGIDPETFVARFPQNRDIWRKHEKFRTLLFETEQGQAACHLLGVSGVRLFHDHAICKPASGSGVIPWHQDSAYWPLDRVGLSLWTPLEDVGVSGGCLEVLDGSHLDGPAEPQDFLSGRCPIREDDPRRVLLPVRRGDTVVLGGLTWHCSAPNRGTSERLAYLTLWVPATSRFVPEHASWHPAAAHISVSPGARLEGDWFPIFGQLASEDEGEHVRFPVPPSRPGPSMFTAGRDITRQLAWLMGREGSSLGALLAGSSEAVTLRALALHLIGPNQTQDLRDLLDDLVFQERVRQQSVARDVYLRTVERWWMLLGHKIAEAQHVS